MVCAEEGQGPGVIAGVKEDAKGTSMKKRFSILTTVLLSAFCLVSCNSITAVGTAVRREATASIQSGDALAFLGDSITAGGASGYCGLVVNGLKSKGIVVKPIYAGVPGNKSSDMLLRLDGILAQKPDYLFLSVGVNDVWHTDETARIGVFKPGPGMGVEFEHFKIYVPQILDRCKEAGTTVIMSTFTQIMEDPEFRLNKKAVAYNDYLRAQARARGLRIALLNEAAFAKIADLKAAGAGARNVISSDGVHPTRVGQETMALGILKALGFTDSELTTAEQTWKSSPKCLIAGDRQVISGCRGGGWVSMVLDSMRSGRETIAGQTVASKDGPAAALVAKVAASIDERTRYMLFVPPLADLKAKTPLKEYQAAIQSLVKTTKQRKVPLVISTIPMVGADPNHALNKAAQPYNALLRRVCKESGAGLADIAGRMADDFAKHPGTRLNIDERLSHAGGVLMAEAAILAFGMDSAILPALRMTWDRRGSYTFKYTDRLTFNVGLSTAGEKALQAITDRFHKLRPDSIMSLGLEMLLGDDAAATDNRLSEASKLWVAADQPAKELSLRRAPGSADQKRAFVAYAEKNDIDLETFYRRAFLVGMYAFRKEDPLGRGENKGREQRTLE